MPHYNKGICQGIRDELKNTIAGIRDGISIQDTNFKILYQNQILKDLLGDHVGEYCYKAYDHRDQVCENCTAMEALKDGNTHSREKILTTEKDKVSLEVQASPIKDSSGRITSIITIFGDIDHRKRAEEALLKQQERVQEQLYFANALNHMSEIIITHERTQTILDTMVKIVGEVLALDHALVIDVNLHQREAKKISAWINQDVESRITNVDIYDFDAFVNSDMIAAADLRCLQSHCDAVNPILDKEGLAKYIHEELDIQSLLWYPFSFHQKGFFLFIFNQVTHQRKWTKDEIEFLKVAAKQVEIAIQKINLLEERKKAEKLLQQQVAAIEASMDGMAVLDREGQFIYLNDAHAQIYGYEHKSDLIGKSWRILYDEEQTKLFDEDNIPQLSRLGKWRGEALGKRADGSIFPQEISLSLINDGGIVCIVRDITERKEFEEQMIYQAHHDSLTGLPNRNLFSDRLGVALSYAQRSNEKLAIMFLDLDRFKIVNDTMGHAIGDQLLKGVARRLSNCLRESDTISRLGGDEFTLLLPKIRNGEDAANVASKVTTAFQVPWELNGNEFLVTTSIGIAIYPDDGDNAESLMKHADTAMYRAKEKGNNYQFFTSSMNKNVIEKLELENSLRQALKKEELVVYYQPQLNTKRNEIIGLEALIRWQHPEKGLIPPMDFIPLAEETGLIVPIGEWVLRTACAQNKAWQEAGHAPMRVTVNLSACQFQQSNLVDKVKDILNETELDPQLLELEITEGVAMKDVEYTIGVLNELRSMGIKIAIDDFGTGYSALNYLKKFPINTLKIDRSFVRDLPTDTDDAAIVSTVIVLAQNLNLNIIAEGVETEEQLSFLKERECHDIQGYLFSKPLPVVEIEDLIRRGF